jgi:DNA polymerase I
MSALLPLPRGLSAVYASDKRAAEICRAMQINGFAFDADRARQLSVELRDLETSARTKAETAVGHPIRSTKTGGFAIKGPGSLPDAFFNDLRAPIYFRSTLTGNPSIDVNALRVYATSHDPQLRQLATAIIEWRNARKIRSTYIDNIHIGLDGRIHPTWLNYGAVSGRWACQHPNLMNLPTQRKDPTSSGVRSLYVAPPGYNLVTFDAKQLEMRVAAYASGDEAMILACNTEDMHAANAEIIFGEAFKNADPKVRKAWRTMAKSAGFAVCYLAEADTVYTRLVAEGVSITMRQVEALLRRLKKGFQQYYAWQSARLSEAIRTGYTDTPLLGRIRYLGHDPEPPACANFPIQGGAADLMNTQLPILVDELFRRSPDSIIVAQVHDSAVFQVPSRESNLVADTMCEVFEQPILISSSGRDLVARFPIDVEISERWS